MGSAPAVAAGTPSLAPRALPFLRVVLAFGFFFSWLTTGFKAADFVINNVTVRFESPHRRNLPRQPQLLPARSNRVVSALSERRSLGENRQIAVFLASVDKRFRTVGPLFWRILGRVQPRAPGIAQEVDVVGWIAAAGHRPDNLVHIGRVDILIDGDNPLGVIRAARTLGCKGQDLRRMAGVSLLHADHCHAESARGGWMAVDPVDTGDAELIQIVPDLGGTDDGKKSALLARRIIR